MKSTEVWARALAGLGGVVGAGLVLAYGFASQVGGMPDAEVTPGVDGLLFVKAVVIGIATIALVGGAVAARPTMIIRGCQLYVVDFVLLLVLYGVTGDQPRTDSIDRGSSSVPSEIALIVLVAWIAFPALTIWLATRETADEAGWVDQRWG
ncbi:hypothetical protein ACFXNW_07105 [Nocardia sp. NPDC059180]|uniref:hypothetical protein n=1 Tax=Nocardia sp. NPDC059180 TaxID=3346761 RepID=UPI00368F8CC8